MSIVAENICLAAPDNDRLNGISCEIKPGELTIVIGPNGSGKSSLIKVLSGELAPTQGQVTLEGQALNHWPSKKLAQRRAVLPQHAVLDFPFRVIEVIELGRSPFLRNVKKDADLIEQALTVFDLLDYANRPYTQLSGGERQRVHLARVWVQICDFDANTPAYLLLDEPTAALDIKHQRALMDLLTLTAKKHNLGVVTALHDLNTAAYYAQSVILLKQGQLFACGRCDQVLNRQNIESVFEVPVELLRYQANGKQPIAIPS